MQSSSRARSTSCPSITPFWSRVWCSPGSRKPRKRSCSRSGEQTVFHSRAELPRLWLKQLFSAVSECMSWLARSAGGNVACECRRVTHSQAAPASSRLQLSAQSAIFSTHAIISVSARCPELASTSPFALRLLSQHDLRPVPWGFPRAPAAARDHRSVSDPRVHRPERALPQLPPRRSPDIPTPPSFFEAVIPPFRRHLRANLPSRPPRFHFKPTGVPVGRRRAPVRDGEGAEGAPWRRAAPSSSVGEEGGEALPAVGCGTGTGCRGTVALGGSSQTDFGNGEDAAAAGRSAVPAAAQLLAAMRMAPPNKPSYLPWRDY